MASQSLAERDDSAVPDLVRTPATTITHEDVALPRLYVGQFMSAAVQQQLVKPGSIFSALSGDDPDPNVLYENGAKGAAGAGVLFYVLSLRKGKSISDGGELTLFDFDDPAAPPDAWTTYNYALLVPAVDTELPCKFLLTRTGRSCAQKINSVILKNNSAPSYLNAFRLTTAQRENTKGKFFVAQVATAEADQEHIKIAEGLAALTTAPPASYGVRGEEPAI